MNRGRLRRTMMQVSVASSLGLGMTLVFLSGGTDASFAQISLSPTCSILDPLTGLCETVTSILNPTPTATSTSTGTSSPTPILTTPTTTVAPTSTGGTTPAASSGTSGGTSVGGKTASSLLAGSNAPFGSAAYGPGGLFMGAYGGNFGGGTTFFTPSAQTTTSHQVYFQSAFGAPVSKEVATAAMGQAIDATPVASAITHVPRTLLLVFPFGLAILSLVTCLVLEVNEGGEGMAALRPTV